MPSLQSICLPCLQPFCACWVLAQSCTTDYRQQPSRRMSHVRHQQANAQPPRMQQVGAMCPLGAAASPCLAWNVNKLPGKQLRRLSVQRKILEECTTASFLYDTMHECVAKRCGSCGCAAARCRRNTNTCELFAAATIVPCWLPTDSLFSCFAWVPVCQPLRSVWAGPRCLFCMLHLLSLCWQGQWWTGAIAPIVPWQAPADRL